MPGLTGTPKSSISCTSMKPGLKIFMVVIVVVVVGTLLLVSLPRGNSTAFPALPSPNGYDDFVAAGNLVSSQVSDAYEMDVDALRPLIATNSEPLRLWQLGLTRTCSVHTLEFLTNSAYFATELSAMKRLAQLALASGRLAELESRTNDAIAIYLAGMRFGNEISRGGFVIHQLVGIACEAMARNRLTAIATNLNVADTQEIILALERMEAESVTWEEVDRNERRYMRTALRQFNNPIALVQAWWSVRAMLRQAKAKNLREIARRRLLIVELALRAHASAHQSPASQLNDLVPEYLARVPLDPFTDQPLIYRPTNTNWLLYSVGQDGVDDGGTRVGRTAGGQRTSGDLRFDTP
jgi:hypothetical protein